MTTNLNSPFDLERCGPAVDLALEKVNREILSVHNVELHKIQARYVISPFLQRGIFLSCVYYCTRRLKFQSEWLFVC